VPGGLILKKIAAWTVVALGLVFFLVPAALLLYLADPRIPPSFEKVRADYKQSEARLLDRYGEVLHEMRLDRQGRRLEWTDLKAISPAFLKAVVEAEDRRFYHHRGGDWRARGGRPGENLFL
jgi:penicillin-binding protein 1C